MLKSYHIFYDGFLFECHKTFTDYILVFCYNMIDTINYNKNMKYIINIHCTLLHIFIIMMVERIYYA